MCLSELKPGLLAPPQLQGLAEQEGRSRSQRFDAVTSSEILVWRNLLSALSWFHLCSPSPRARTTRHELTLLSLTLDRNHDLALWTWPPGLGRQRRGTSVCWGPCTVQSRHRVLGSLSPRTETRAKNPPLHPHLAPKVSLGGPRTRIQTGQESSRPRVPRGLCSWNL